MSESSLKLGLFQPKFRHFQLFFKLPTFSDKIQKCSDIIQKYSALIQKYSDMIQKYSAGHSEESSHNSDIFRKYSARIQIYTCIYLFIYYARYICQKLVYSGETPVPHTYLINNVSLQTNLSSFWPLAETLFFFFLICFMSIYRIISYFVNNFILLT